MKTLCFLVLSLISFQLFAVACRCTCGLGDRQLCASSIYLDRPCAARCPSKAGPIGGTTCRVIKVFNERKGIYQWVSTCENAVEPLLDVGL